MSKKKIYKCSGKRREFCVNIDKFASDQDGSGRRLFVGQSMNRETGREGVRVWYAFGAKRNEFVLTLFCPWCGGRVGWNKEKSNDPHKSS